MLSTIYLSGKEWCLAVLGTSELLRSPRESVNRRKPLSGVSGSGPAHRPEVRPGEGRLSCHRLVPLLHPPGVGARAWRLDLVLVLAELRPNFLTVSPSLTSPHFRFLDGEPGMGLASTSQIAVCSEPVSTRGPTGTLVTASLVPGKAWASALSTQGPRVCPVETRPRDCGRMARSLPGC